MIQKENSAGKFSSAPKEILARLSFSDDECQVLACVGRSARLSEILDRCGLAEAQALDALLMLRAKGAVIAIKRKKRPVPAPALQSVNDAEPETTAAPSLGAQVLADGISTSEAPSPEAPNGDDLRRAEERRQRLARHPYLTRIKRQYRPS